MECPYGQNLHLLWRKFALSGERMDIKSTLQQHQILEMVFDAYTIT